MNARCFVCCAGVPTCPVGPLQVTDVRSTSAVLHWQRPTDDGGRPLMYALYLLYCFEMRIHSMSAIDETDNGRPKSLVIPCMVTMTV